MDATAIDLAALTEPDLIFPDLAPGDASAVLRQMSERLAAAGRVKKPDVLFASLREREELGSTALGHGVAVPHCRVAGLAKLTLAVGLCRPGVDFAAEDGLPVQVFFLVVSPQNAAAEHLHCLAAISKWIRRGQIERLVELESPEEIHRLLSAHLPQGGSVANV